MMTMVRRPMIVYEVFNKLFNFIFIYFLIAINIEPLK